MILLPITVRNKIATFTGDVPYICGNSDYKAVFTFDDEWDEHSHKTARFVYGSSYTDVLFEGNECSFPMIEETTMVVVGVYAGNLRTTTGASVRAILSIRSEHGSPESPKPDVYEQIMETLDGYDDRLEDVEKKLSYGGGGDGSDRYVADYKIITEYISNKHTLVLIYNDGTEMEIPLPQMGIDIDRIVKFGETDPTEETQGHTKQLYVNTATGKMWVCTTVGISATGYDWVAVSGGGDGWTIDGLTAETAFADDDTVPFYDTSAKAQRKTLWSNIKAVFKTYFDTVYLKLSGGVLSGKIVLPTGNQSIGFTNSEDQKIFGYGNIDSVSHMRIGDVSKPLQLRGSDASPKYNNDTLVLKTEFETALGAYITDIDALVGGEE